MNAFIKKEVRLLLPNFGFACVLALSGLFFRNNHDSLLNGIPYFAAFVFCPAVVVMLVISPFGVEVGSGTLANLLAQPVPRQKIWDTKIKLLAFALLVLGVLWVAATYLGEVPSHVGHDEGEDLDLLSAVIVFGLVVFSGGLWTVLLLRQVAAAFWFTLLVPGALMVPLAAFFAGDDGNFFAGIIISVLGLYSLAGFFFARWLFFHAQDVHWSGGTIVMPEMRGLAWMKSAGERRAWRPRAALWRKEFQLHQAQYVMAFVLLVLHLGVLATRHFGHFRKNSSTEYVLECFWGLWFVLPLLVGCAAVAEERKLGTLGGQLCLPAKQRTQFAVKFITMLLLSVSLGAIMPLLLEGSRLLPSAPHFFFADANLGWFKQPTQGEMDFWLVLATIVRSLPVLMFVGVAVAIGVIAFYTSSLARNTLQALGPAVIACAVFFSLLISMESLNRFHSGWWQGQLHYLIILPLMFIAGMRLALKNFQQLSVGGKLWARNGAQLVLTLAVSIFITVAVYHRAWEKLSPFEPAHGAARLSLSDPAQLNSWGNDVNARLPDGRAWSASIRSKFASASPDDWLLAHLQVTLSGKNYWPGSNWLTVQRYWTEIIGIKTDGTLWISEASAVYNPRRSIDSWDESKMTNLVQFGDETDWQSAVEYNHCAFLIKKDGTLWRLGDFNFRESKTNRWPGLRAFTPVSVGRGWRGETRDYSGLTFEKNDGSLWLPEGETNELPGIEIAPDFFVMRYYDGKQGRFRSTVDLQSDLRFKVGIREDGTFRIWCDEYLNTTRKHYGYYELRPADVQIGSGTNWVAAIGCHAKIITLKRDGTLWLWDFSRPFFRPGITEDWSAKFLEREIRKSVPVQLGSHSDWIAISREEGDFFALAADGSLWYWPLSSAPAYFCDGDSSGEIQPLLDVSHKPQLVGNVFATTP